MPGEFQTGVYTIDSFRPRWLSGNESSYECRRLKKMQVQSLGWEDPLEEKMATHSSVLAWKIPWTEEPDRLPMGLQWVKHNWAYMHRTSSSQTSDSNWKHIIFSSGSLTCWLQILEFVSLCNCIISCLIINSFLYIRVHIGSVSLEKSESEP